LCAAGAGIVLANAYHCYLRPGAAIIERAGGLHSFMGWERAILTDSGGFQVFSLSALARIDDAGYHFASHLDGSRHSFTPESVVKLQETLGSDIAMVLDDCIGAQADGTRVQESARRTLQWAQRSRQAHTRREQLQFGIVQGAANDRLRAEQARDLATLDFDGYGIGGLWVGESKATSLRMAALTCDALPAAAPRYLMGVGTAEDIIAGIAVGVDMFDCVYPTRCARHALALTSVGRLNLRNAAFTADFRRLDPHCSCVTCTRFTRAYLAHCVRARESIAARLLSLHNLTFLIGVSKEARAAIVDGRLQQWRAERSASIIGQASAG